MYEEDLDKEDVLKSWLSEITSSSRLSLIMPDNKKFLRFS
jgi:hypothetical protein